MTFTRCHPEQRRQHALRLTWVTATAHEPRVTSGGSVCDLPQASGVPKAPPGWFFGNEPTRCPYGGPPRGKLALRPLFLNRRGLNGAELRTIWKYLLGGNELLASATPSLVLSPPPLSPLPPPLPGPPTTPPKKKKITQASSQEKLLNPLLCNFTAHLL